MKDKRKNIMLIIIIACIFVLIGIIISFLSSKDKIESLSGDFKRELLGRIIICTKCPAPNSFPYYKITHSNKNIQNVLDNMNQEAETRYKKALNSEVKSHKECKNAHNKYQYKYGIYAISDYNFYENDKYISVAYRFDEVNNCENTHVISEPKVSIYSKKKKKFLSREEFMTENYLDEESVHNYIESFILAENDSSDIKYSLNYLKKNGRDEYSFYYTNDGALSLYFYQSNTDEYLSIET